MSTGRNEPCPCAAARLKSLRRKLVALLRGIEASTGDVTWMCQ